MKLRKNRGWVLGWVGATAATQLQCSDFSLTDHGCTDQALCFVFSLKKSNIGEYYFDQEPICMSICVGIDFAVIAHSTFERPNLLKLLESECEKNR